MRNFTLVLVFFISTYLSAQKATIDEFIFDSSITEQYGSSFDEIISVMANYYKGVENSDEELLNGAFHSEWHMRDNDGTNNQSIHIEDKPTFISRVKHHGDYKDYANHRKIAAIEVVHDQLAFVRIDKAPTRSATLFFLAKIDKVWGIIDKLWVYQEENYKPLPSNELLSTIENFYANMQPIDKEFDSMLFSNNAYQTFQKSKLADDKIKLVSTLGVYDRLAVVRTDYPILKTTAFLVLFRLDSGWKVACERISTRI